MIKKIICMMTLLIILPSVIAIEEISSNVNISFMNNTLQLDFERDSFSYSNVSFINETKPIYLIRDINFTDDQEELFANLTAYCSKQKPTECSVEEAVCTSTLNESLLQTSLTNCESNSRFYKNYYTENNDPEKKPANPTTMLFVGFIAGLASMRFYLGRRIIPRIKPEKELRLGNEVDEKRFM